MAVERFWSHHCLGIYVTERVGDRDFKRRVGRRSHDVEHMRVAQWLGTAVGVEVEHPQTLRNVVRNHIERTLGLLALDVELATILADGDFPIGCPIPNVNHHGVVRLECAEVGTLRVVVEQDAPSMGLSAMESIKKSVEYLKSFEW